MQPKPNFTEMFESIRKFFQLDEFHPKKLLDANDSRDVEIERLRPDGTAELARNKGLSKPQNNYFHCQGENARKYAKLRDRTPMQRDRIKNEIPKRVAHWRTPLPDKTPAQNAERANYINRWTQEYSDTMRQRGQQRPTC